MSDTQSATIGSSPGEIRSDGDGDGRRNPPDWVLALLAVRALLEDDPTDSFRFKIEADPRDPRIEHVKAAFLDEQRGFYNRLTARVRLLAMGQPDNQLPPAVGQFHCQSCGAEYDFDRRGMLRKALHARGEPYGIAPTPAVLREALDVVVTGLAEELNSYAAERILEQLGTTYKLKLTATTDGSGDVIASAGDEWR